MGVFEVRDEVFAVLAAAAALTCLCRAETVCLGCRARTVHAEVTARGIRMRRWRNDAADGFPRHVLHTAGPVQVTREDRPSCRGYITDRWQTCADCDEPLATGKWAIFFPPGSNVTKLQGKDGRQDLPNAVEPGHTGHAVSCDQLSDTPDPNPSLLLLSSGRLCSMTPQRQPRRWRRLPYGWTIDAETREVAADPVEQGVRRAIVQLRTEQDMTYERIAGVLNESGYPTKAGRVWSPMQVQRILTVPIDPVLASMVPRATPIIPTLRLPKEGRTEQPQTPYHDNAKNEPSVT